MINFASCEPLTKLCIFVLLISNIFVWYLAPVCTNTTCYNGGTCVRGRRGTFTCICPPFFTGERCETGKYPVYLKSNFWKSTLKFRSEMTINIGIVIFDITFYYLEHNHVKYISLLHDKKSVTHIINISLLPSCHWLGKISAVQNQNTVCVFMKHSRYFHKTYNFISIHYHAKKVYLQMFDIINTVKSDITKRIDRLLIFAGLFKGKGSS